MVLLNKFTSLFKTKTMKTLFAIVFFVICSFNSSAQQEIKSLTQYEYNQLFFDNLQNLRITSLNSFFKLRNSLQNDSILYQFKIECPNTIYRFVKRKGDSIFEIATQSDSNYFEILELSATHKNQILFGERFYVNSALPHEILLDSEYWNGLDAKNLINIMFDISFR